MNEQMIRKNNMKVFPMYKMFSWDLLFCYAIMFLFLTQVKGFTASEVLIAESFYSFFRITFQIVCVKVCDRIGKKKSLLLGNIFVTISMIGVILCNNLFLLIVLYFIQANGYSLKSICEPTLLSDSIPKTSLSAKLYAKIDSKGSSRFFIFDAITSFSTGFLYVLNPYLPLILCSLCCIIATILSLCIDEPVKTNTQKVEALSFIEYYKDIFSVFKQIIKSNRLKSLFIHSLFFYGILSVFGTLRSSILVEINVPNQYFGIIVAFMQILSAIASKKQDWFNQTFKNRILSWFSLSIVVSFIITGLVVVCNINYGLSLACVLITIMLFGIIKGPYYTLFQRYLNSFSNPEVNTKIFAIDSIVGNIGRITVSLFASVLLGVTQTSYAFIIIGCVFFVIFIYISNYMKFKLGLKPEEYPKEDLIFSNEPELKK